MTRRRRFAIGITLAFWLATCVAQPSAVDREHTFDSGSGISVHTLSPVQVDSLVLLGKVWGFLKYHHPAVTSGQRRWDDELFRILPQVLAARDAAGTSDALVAWIDSLGPIERCRSCASAPGANEQLAAPLAWLDSDARLGNALRGRLRNVYANRPRGDRQFYISMTQTGNPVFEHEPAYATQTASDFGDRLLAVYRFWNIVEYWFPYRNLLDDDWDEVLARAIAKVTLAKDDLAYRRELMALIARLHDSHANLWSSLAVRPPTGLCRVAVNLRFVQDRLVVSSYADALLGSATGLVVGDEIVAIDGRRIDDLVRDWAPYYAASNVASQRREMSASATQGNCGGAALTVQTASGTKTLTVPRIEATQLQPERTHDRPGDAFQRLSGDIAYLKLSSAKVADVARYLDDAKGSKGLIVDLRNYPSEFVVFALGGHFVETTTPFVKFTLADTSNPGAFTWSDNVSLSPLAPRYPGRIVILVDETSQSQAEYTAMAFRSAPGALIVGSMTAGADGNVSRIPLPGDLFSMVSGIGVFYPDKGRTQRLGIRIDKEVRPTIAGIRDGADEVLQAGIQLILSPASPP
jgi:C-terminal processing protease CtpA/Prc